MTPSELEYWDSVAKLDSKQEVWGLGWGRDVLAECRINLLDGIEDTKNKDALEIGSGMGRLTNEMGSVFRSVVGIDVSEGMIQHALKESPPNVSYVVCDGSSIPMGDDYSTDFVYSMCVFQHLDEETVQGYISEAYRVLRPGGTLRFQYVEGGYHDHLNHKYMHDLEMKPWIVEAGFRNVTVRRGLMLPQWTWITATK